MDIKVISLSQEVSFEDASITNILLVRLPSGRPMRAVITDAAAKMLYEDLASTSTGAPHVEEQRYEPPQREEEEPADPGERHPPSQEVREDGAVVFGGEGSDEVEPAPGRPWLPAPPAPEQALIVAPKVWTDPDAQARAFREQQQKTRKEGSRGRPGATVPKDGMGYPLPPGRGGVNASDVVGGGVGADEDGVGQV